MDELGSKNRTSFNKKGGSTMQKVPKVRSHVEILQS